MLARVLAVVLGLAACQISMVACIILALAAFVAWTSAPLLALAATLVLLSLPGLLGGGLAGFVTDQFGWFYGGTTTSLFASTILAVKLWIAPLLLGPAPAGDLPVVAYLLLISFLGTFGIAGGALGHRQRQRRRRSLA